MTFAIHRCYDHPPATANFCHHVNLDRKNSNALRLSQNTQRLRVCFQTLYFLSKTQLFFCVAVVRKHGVAHFLVLQKNVTRKHFRHSSVLFNPLMRYMSVLTTVVKEKIKSVLSGRSAAIVDGWSDSNTFYVSVFATFPADQPRGFNSVLLATAPNGRQRLSHGQRAL